MIIKESEEQAQNVSIITYQMDNIQKTASKPQEAFIFNDAQKQQEEDLEDQLKNLNEKEVIELTQTQDTVDKESEKPELNWNTWQEKEEKVPNDDDKQTQPNSDENNSNQQEGGWWSKLKKSAGVGAAASGISAVGAKVGLTLYGFSSVGPVAGSMAAATQASIGNVAAGSLFAFCQSVAMSGVAPFIAPAAAVGVVAGGGYYLYQHLKKNPDNTQNTENTENIENTVNPDNTEKTENTENNQPSKDEQNNEQEPKNSEQTKQ